MDKQIKIISLVSLLFLISGCGAEISVQRPTSHPNGSYGKAVFDVRDFGAKGDGVDMDTAAIQSAIDRCSEYGGGTVLFPSGKYLTGTIYIKSNVTVHLQADATVLGSVKIGDYATDVAGIRYRGKQFDECLIYAEDASNIALTGMGTVDGQGHKENFPYIPIRKYQRPMLMRFINCKNIDIKDLTFKNAASWCSSFILCDDIKVDGIVIDNMVNWNGDGLDFDSCSNVFVSNCKITTSDDSICLQNSEKDNPCKNVVITNCIISSKWAAIRIGPLSCGDFENVTVSNCVFEDIRGSGLKIQMSEGARMENMLFSNLVMKNVARPIFLTFQQRAVRRDASEELPPMKTFRNFQFSNIRAEADSNSTYFKEGAFSLKSGFIIVGVPGNRIENIMLSDIHFTAPGGGTKADADRRDIPEMTNNKPEHSVFGDSLPAYGLYARHVKGLTLNNVKFDLASPDVRPAVICDDVSDMVISDSKAFVSSDAECMIRLKNVQQAWIRNCQPFGSNKTFLQVEGKESKEILLSGNDLRKFDNSFSCINGAAKDAVTATNNIN